ncbi:Tetratricopeptide repeat protein 37 [Oopsacas minuta]|uniref:Tetratricopeptide repeat protein 37 n=1 Tax=Oopsacas minuta TaxID=111878 RepID=A0AAV7JJX7_9METZ|nr:Tetratricopeptide repeat protein 37 [Oopsacas minuta]
MAEGKSSKEVRSLLKRAKSCVDKSDYITAIQHLNNVLNLEQDNCNGLLMKGFVLIKQGGTDEAESVLWRVVELQEGGMSGWQGLKELYEREGGTETRKDKESLCRVYTNLLKLYSEENKKFTILEKLSNILIRLDRKLEALDYYISYFSICVEQNKQQQIYKYWEQTLNICVNKTSKQKFDELFPKIREFYLNLSENGFINDVIIPYITLLYNKIFLSYENYDIFTLHIIEVICQLETEIPENVCFMAKEMLFVFTLTFYDKIDIQGCEFMINTVLDDLLKLICQEKFIQSFEKLHLLSDFENSIFPGKWAKLKCFFGTYQFRKVTDICYEELGVINRNQTPHWFHLWYKNELLLMLAETYFEMEDIKHSKNILTELKNLDSKQELKLKYMKICLLISDKHFEEALTLFETVSYKNDVIKWLCLKSEILSQNGSNDKSIELIKQLINENDTSSLCHFTLGMCYWRSGLVAREDKEKCLKCFLISFSLDQLNYKPMQYIGNYYNTISINLTKSRKCFEKACQLAPWSNKLGQVYGDLLIDLGQEEYALEFYRSLSLKISPNTGKWIWIRLGLSERKAKNFPETIRCFQNALNCDESDPRVLECLGEVYLVRGSLLGALASFEAVLKIEEDNLFCLYETGCIRKEAGETIEAVDIFQKVLQLNSTYIPALLSAAECHYNISVESIHTGLLPVAVIHIEKGLEFVAKCCELKSDYISVWLCIGEIGMLGRHFDAHTKINTNSTTLFPQLKDNMVSPADLLQLSIKSFHMCVSLSPHHSNLLYLLSLSYYYSMTDGSIELAYKYCMNAIILNDGDYRYWNLLGLILLSREVRQSSLIRHSFVKSLSLQSDHITWTNLGYFYMTEGEYELALKCFENAKSTDPLSIYPWIGLAFMAQLFNRHKQSLGLFRHQNGMGYQQESALLFGWKVCEVIVQSDKKEIYGCNGEVKPEFLDYLLLARDRLYHYSLHHSNATASNMLAVLYEMEGVYTLAVDTYMIAIHMLDTESKEYTKVLTNLIRASNKAKRKEFNKELLHKLPKSPTNILQNSISLFYARNYTESLNLLNELIPLIEHEDDINDVNYMIGLVANQARDQRLANGTLAKLSKGKLPLEACTALCCIGFVYGNLKLVEGSVTRMHEVSCGDWGAPPCHNLSQVVLILESLLLHYSSDSKGISIEIVKKLDDLVTQLSPKVSDTSTQKIKLLSDLQNGVKLPLCQPTPPKIVTAFIQPDILNQSDLELEIQPTDRLELKEELVPVMTTKQCMKTAQKLIYVNPSDVTCWTNLIISISYQIWLSADRTAETQLMVVLVVLLRRLIESSKEISSLNNWCIQTYISLVFYFKPFGIYFEDFSVVTEHPLALVYRTIQTLKQSPDTELIDLCKDTLQTQIALCRYLVKIDSYIPALNSYKTALMLGKSISNQCMVFVLIEMALQSICWFKRCVREKVKFPQEVNLHKIAKDNLIKSKQLIPQISDLTEVLKKANEDLHNEFYFIQK